MGFPKFIITTKQKNFMGPAMVGLTLLLLSIVSHKFSTSCDSLGFKRG
jgi:hypothetical protein